MISLGLEFCHVNLTVLQGVSEDCKTFMDIYEKKILPKIRFVNKKCAVIKVPTICSGETALRNKADQKAES